MESQVKDLNALIAASATSMQDDPNSLDSLIPKLKQIHTAFASLDAQGKSDCQKAKLKSAKRLAKAISDAKDEFYDKALPLVINSPCKWLLDIFRMLPLADESRSNTLKSWILKKSHD